MDEFARYLVDALPNAEVRVFCSQAEYRSKNKAQSGDGIAVERLSFAKVPVPGNIGRLLTSMIEGRKLAREAVKWGDVVISMTDPPLLGYWIARELDRLGDRAPVWIEWTMDLYPEAFVAAGLSTPKNPIYKTIEKKLKDVTPDAFICLGPEQAKFVAERRTSHAPTFILPCGIVDRSDFEGGELPSWRVDEDRIVFVYAGNIGQAHCVDLLPTLIECSDPEKHVFVLALYGAHADATKQRVSSASNVKHVEYVSYAEAIHADVHIASLDPTWNHVCVPSKAVSSVCLGKPILYAGNDASDNSNMLARGMWRVERDGELAEYKAQLTEVLSIISAPEMRSEKQSNALKIAGDLASLRNSTFAEINDWISSNVPANGIAPSEGPKTVI
ncbi:MAG: hypothetical protein AAFX32_05135 [Pseudomonadota bacterium]